MKNLICGIIAVFCAQLAFIGYSYLGQPLDTASVSPVETFGPLFAGLEPEPDTIATVRPRAAVTGVRVKRIAASEPAFITAKHTIKLPRKNFVDRNPGLIAFQKPIVITYRTEYPIASVSSRESDDRRYIASIKPTNEKKSLVSKALPIIKKPYDWLKAIASKMR